MVMYIVQKPKVIEGYSEQGVEEAETYAEVENFGVFTDLSLAQKYATVKGGIVKEVPLFATLDEAMESEIEKEMKRFKEHVRRQYAGV